MGSAMASASPSSQRVDDKVKETTSMASASPSPQRVEDKVKETTPMASASPAEVFKHFLFGFPPLREAFNKLCLGRKSEEDKDLNNVDQKDHVEATAEEIQEDNGKKDYEVEDNQNDREVVSEIIAQKKTNRAPRYFHKCNSGYTSTCIAKNQTADESGTSRFKIGSASAKNTNRGLAHESLQKEQKTDSAMSPEPLRFNRSRSGRLLLPPMAFWRNERAIYDASRSIIAVKQGDLDLDNLRRETNNHNNWKVVSEVITQKKTNRAPRYFHKRNSAYTSTSIAKQQTADDSGTSGFKIGSASTKNTKRRLAYESPPKEQKTDSAMSPESFNRSRSGRLLLPPMAFWRNERAIYDASHGVTAVKQGNLDQDNLRRVSRSEPSRKRRRQR